MTYGQLFTEVYELINPGPPEHIFNFYMDYARAARGLILEPMCGTGNFLLPIQEEGIEIHGFDSSYYMLKKLKAKCKAKNLKPKIWQQFLQKLEVAYRYDLIFIPLSFGLIIDPNEARLCIKKIYQHLDDGGKFIFDQLKLYSGLTQPVEQTGVWNGRTIIRPDGDIIILSVLPLTPINEVETVIARIELVQQGKVTKTEVENFQSHLYNLNKINDWLLQESGFRDIKIFKFCLHNEIINKDNEITIFECTK